ncbi:MAG: glucose-6-phosphate dehydrogenase, partial [Candidatus Saccharimonadales bacterium]
MTEQVADQTLIVDPSIIVIFGITGDLAQRKLLPALYRLIKAGLIHKNTQIVGITRRDVDVDQLLKPALDDIKADAGAVDGPTLARLKRIIHMHRMSMVDEADYGSLQELMDQLEEREGLCLTRLFYLAIPPQIIQPVVGRLGSSGLNKGCRRHNSAARLLLEKPFGFDSVTAQELITATTQYFSEEQIFRIDHYLAKETVQNIITFRFNNPVFEPLWGLHQIRSVEVVADEKIGIEGRANFYEQTGALRDLIQSHLLHVMSVVMMAKPVNPLQPAAIHKARLELLESIKPVPADAVGQQTVRGQYQSYRREVDNPSSNVETFAALKLFSKDPSWKDVPIILRTGKGLKHKQTLVNIDFKPTADDGDHANRLSFQIQPNEGINISLWVKKPGFVHQLQTVDMSFTYQQAFTGDINPDAYERVLVDAIRGDNTL